MIFATQRGYGDLKGGLVLKEHEAARWQAREQLGEVEWLPADVTLRWDYYESYIRLLQ